MCGLKNIIIIDHGKTKKNFGRMPLVKFDALVTVDIYPSLIHKIGGGKQRPRSRSF